MKIKNPFDKMPKRAGPVISNLGMTKPTPPPTLIAAQPALAPAPTPKLALPALAPLLSPKKARPKQKVLSLSRGEKL